jgi:hypothetical protein
LRAVWRCQIAEAAGYAGTGAHDEHRQRAAGDAGRIEGFGKVGANHPTGGHLGRGSHWMLDLIVHRPDLPILPGNAGNLPLFGFGVWQLSVVAGLVELGLVVAGAYLYYRAATLLPAVAGLESAVQRRRRLVASAVVSGLLGLSFSTTVLGLP